MRSISKVQDMKRFSIEFKWAALATLAALIWMFFEKYLGYHSEYIRMQMLFNMLFNIILAFIYIASIKEKKRDFYKNNISWRQAFFSGLILCVLITIFYPIIQYITFQQVSPHFFDQLIQIIVESGEFTLEEAQKNFNFDSYLRQGASGNLSFGVVVSAIAAYYLKTKDSATPSNTPNANKNRAKKNSKNKK